MDPQLKSSVLWGAVGAMAFLVLVQGYHLVADDFLGLGPMAAGALAVLVATTALSHAVRPRLLQNESP
ncbi:hypothetical protein [Salinibaculum rarum]|jgi:hypothetical protein|uniref:hypothetical protein n=1 Tax=Salinibaculum rarum TaxID=3058903 RepID=UPI00265F8362|nr:hypothetical protein [Salinibaculum sp. KK48]